MQLRAVLILCSFPLFVLRARACWGEGGGSSVASELRVEHGSVGTVKAALSEGTSGTSS